MIDWILQRGPTIIVGVLVIHSAAVALSYLAALYVSEDGVRKTTVDFCTMSSDEIAVWTVLAGYLLPFIAAYAGYKRTRARI